MTEEQMIREISDLLSRRIGGTISARQYSSEHARITKERIKTVLEEIRLEERP